MARGQERTTRVWTLPNLLSLARLGLIPVFLWLVLGPQADAWALGVLMLSGITDFLDGYLARKLNQRSSLGEVLDPAADRLYIMAVVVGLALRGIVPWWIALLLPLRDAMLWGLVPFLRKRGYSALPVHFLEGVAAGLARVFGWAFAYWGIALYWWAGLLYAWQVRKLLTDDRRASTVDDH